MLSLLPAAFCLFRASLPRAEQAPGAASLFDFTMRLIDGTQQSLSAYRGKLLLVVNTASQCRYTPQYEGLEKLYQAYRARGFVILGFPSNDFRGKEPGTATEIGTFCRAHGVSFPLFDKVQVIDPDACPLYHFLAAKHGPPKWNFHKYLVGPNGQVIDSFLSAVTPESPILKTAIETHLPPQT